MRYRQNKPIDHFRDRLEEIEKACREIILPKVKEPTLQNFLDSLSLAELNKIGGMFAVRFREKRDRHYWKLEDYLEEEYPHYKSWMEENQRKSEAFKKAAQPELDNLEKAFAYFEDLMMMPKADYMKIINIALLYKENQGWRKPFVRPLSVSSS